MAKLGDQLANLVDDSPDALLCFGTWSHFVQERPLGESPASLPAVMEVLGLFVKYGRILRKAAHMQDVADKPQLHRVFGVTIGSTTDVTSGVVVHPHSFIYTDAVNEVEKGSASKLDAGGILLARPRAAKLISSSLNTHYDDLLNSVLDAIDRSINSAPFDICFNHVMTGKCPSQFTGCPRLHPAPEDLNVKFFNNRVRLHLLVIALFDQSVSKAGRVAGGRMRRDRQG